MMMTMMSEGQDNEARSSVDPLPLFELSPYVYMQVLVPVRSGGDGDTVARGAVRSEESLLDRDCARPAAGDARRLTAGTGELRQDGVYRR